MDTQFLISSKMIRARLIMHLVIITVNNLVISLNLQYQDSLRKKNRGVQRQLKISFHNPLIRGY